MSNYVKKYVSVSNIRLLPNQQGLGLATIFLFLFLHKFNTTQDRKKSFHRHLTVNNLHQRRCGAYKIDSTFQPFFSLVRMSQKSNP